jgi:hypothetical protein
VDAAELANDFEEASGRRSAVEPLPHEPERADVVEAQLSHG